MILLQMDQSKNGNLNNRVQLSKKEKLKIKEVDIYSIVKGTHVFGLSSCLLTFIMENI